MLLYTASQMPSVKTKSSDASNRPKLAAAINTVKYHLHGQHILDRLLDGYGWNGDYHHPAMGQLRVPTPNLDIHYQSNPQSTFWRN